MRCVSILLLAVCVLGGAATRVPAATPSSASWHPIPALPTGSMTAFDPVRHRMILIPGWSSGGPLPDLRVLDTHAPDHWSVIHTHGTPPPVRGGRVVAYDPPRDRLLFYGGVDFISDTTDGDVWALSLGDSPTWSKLSAPAGPAPSMRGWSSMVYDPVRDRLVVFGGGHYLQGMHLLADVWTYALSGAPGWSMIVPTEPGPTARLSAAAIYDPVRDRLVLHGGGDSIALWTNGGPRGDAWALPLSGTATWTELFQGSTPEQCYGAHTGIYDPVRDRMLLMGGEDSTWYPRGYHAEVQALSLAPPSELDLVVGAGSGPGGRSGMACVYDPGLDAVFIEGGATADTWRLNLSAPTGWTQLLPAEVVPHSRFGQVQAYDALRNRTVFHGGRYTYYAAYEYSTTYYDDLWSLTLGDHPVWTPIDGSGARPPGRQYATLTADASADRMWLLGGNITTGIFGPQPEHSTGILIGSVGTPRFYGDLWRLDLATSSWTMVVPSGSVPGPRDGHSTVLDSRRHRLLVFGGRDSLGPMNDVWSLSLDDPPQWTLLAPLGSAPSPRVFQVAAYDSIGDRMVVACGRSAGGTALGDAWALSLSGTPTWTPLSTTGTAPLITAPRPGVLDPVSHCLVVDGDEAAGSYALHALTLDGSPTWSTIGTLDPEPGIAYGRSLSFDPSSGQFVALWGTNGSRGESPEGTASTFTLDPPPPASVPVPVSPRFALSAPRPNPVRGAVRLIATLTETGAARIDLFDISGRRIARHELNPVAIGLHEVRFDASALGAGVYLARLQQGSRFAVAKICVVR